MHVLSLKPFLGRDQTALNLVAAQQRMIASLLDGIVIHAVRGAVNDYSRLQNDFASLRESINPLSTPEDLLIGTGSALQALQDYNRRTAAFAHAQSRELQKITSMLTETIVHLSSAGNINASRLHEIERQIERASEFDDMRKLKERLADCLLAIREEKIRQQQTSAATVGVLTATLKSAAAVTGSCDPLTGLCSRPEAEMALAGALDERQSAFAAFFVIDHLHSLNVRFGRKVGDEIIMMFAQHLAQNLRAEDLVFRWSGPSFLVVLHREGTADKVRRDLMPLVKTRLEKTVDSQKRTVLLPVNFTWMLFPVLDFDATSLLVTKIDAFLNTQIGPES